MSVKANLLFITLGYFAATAAPVFAGSFSSATFSMPSQLQSTGGGPLTFGQDTGSAGGPLTINGISYVAETYFTSANVFGGPSAFSNSSLNLIMQDGRYGSTLTANIPVNVGVNYNLQLLFWDPVNTYVAGSRKMNITAEGDTLTGFDIIATTSGWNSALGVLVNYSFVAADSTLNLSIAGADGTDPYALVNGFSLVPEPSSISIATIGFAALVQFRRRRTPREA